MGLGPGSLTFVTAATPRGAGERRVEKHIPPMPPAVATATDHPGEGRGPFLPRVWARTRWDHHYVKVEDRSFQWRFSRSIRLIFQFRFHSLICFSRCNAVSLDWCASNQTSRSTPYRLVKPGTTLFLCSQIRRTRSDVVPV